MSDGITIKLDKPIIRPGKDSAEEVHEIKLREPVFDDIMTLGEPSAFARDAGGMIYTAEKDETIRAYIERLVVDLDVLLLKQLNARDTFKLRDAVHGFFANARPATS